MTGNPFQWFPRASTAKEHQSNANHATYNRMAACETLAEYDAAKVKAPYDVIADSHTSKWVEKDLIRVAQNARQREKESTP